MVQPNRDPTRRLSPDQATHRADRLMPHKGELHTRGQANDDRGLREALMPLSLATQRPGNRPTRHCWIGVQVDGTIRKLPVGKIRAGFWRA